MRSTAKQSSEEPDDAGGFGAPVPGLILVFSGHSPKWGVFPIKDGEIVLGRESLAASTQDSRISRAHTRVFARDGWLHAEDLESRNGTYVDGSLLAASESRPIKHCLRIGDTLFLLAKDIRPYQRAEVQTEAGRVLGPKLRRIYGSIARLARMSSTLHISGETGVGKEDAARTFHSSIHKTPGPFIAVNCATVPEGLAERLLFGAKRGAFSGADADVPGYVQAAHGGTLFLDEVAELHSAVQAKLLRVLENREVQCLGAVRPIPVDLRICSASHASLRGQVAAGKLREDLYYRLGRPEVTIPALRDRREEIPWLIDSELLRIDGAPPPHFSFIEACLARSWPGNVRELLGEVRIAAQEAIGSGSRRLEGKHLAEAAGQAINVKAPPPSVLLESHVAPDAPAESLPRPREDDIQRSKMEELLLQTGGNVAKAARLLGMHRNSLRRLIERGEINCAQLPDLLSKKGGQPAPEKT